MEKDREYSELVAKCERRLSYMATYMALHDRFNYEIFTRMQKEPSETIPTAGVSPDGTRIKLLYSPKYIDSLSVPELAYVISHEVAHVVLHHFDRCPPAGKVERGLYNIAADLAVNSLFTPREGIKEVPLLKEDSLLPNGDVLARRGSPSALVPSLFGFPERLSLEGYYSLLLDKFQEEVNEDPGEEGEDPGDSPESGGEQGEDNEGGTGDSGDSDTDGDAQSDSHSQWKADSIAQAVAKEWVETVDKFGAWGDVGGDVRSVVRAAQTTSVPWDQLIRQKYGDMVSIKKVSTYKRPSRRFGYPWCSKMTEPRDKKLVIIDVSGSISDKEVSRFKAETDRLSEEQHVDYITFDTQVLMDEALPWDPGLEFHFEGRGGTDVRPALKFAEERGYADCIVLTDGYFPTPEEPDGVSVLWVITPGGCVKPAPFGDVVLITRLD